MKTQNRELRDTVSQLNERNRSIRTLSADDLLIKVDRAIRGWDFVKGVNNG